MIIAVAYLGIVVMISQSPADDATAIDDKLISMSSDNRLELLVQITGVNPLEGTANARVLPWPNSDDIGYRLKSGWVPGQDIDLIVDKTILEKLPLIYSKYKSDLIFINRENFLIKLCSRKGIEVNNKHINRYVINPYDKYKWPFIDLFIYDYNSPELQSKPQIQHQTNIIKFFDKKWLEELYSNSLYDTIYNYVAGLTYDFLRINFGNDYMTTLKSNKYNHRQEIPNGKVKEIKK
mgnify:CR=1 FL=1